MSPLTLGSHWRDRLDGTGVLHSSCGEDGEVGAVFIADFDIVVDGLLAVLSVLIEAYRFQGIDRHCERSGAIQRAGNGLLRRFAPRNDERNGLGQRALGLGVVKDFLG